MRAFARSSLLLAVLLTLLGIPRGVAHAHGGAYRGPSAGVVPGGRGGPQDPVPPRPPGPKGAQGDDENPVAVEATKTRPRRRSISLQDWVFWYHHNNAPLERVKIAIYSRTSTDSPFGRSAFLSHRQDTTYKTRMSVKQRILPALLRVVADRSLHQDLRSAAFIALGKLTPDPAHLAVLRRALDPAQRERSGVRESAALALGLLRRTRRTEQFPAQVLDEIRTHLFTMFEDARFSVRMRGFAAVALGLLGDQPSGDPKGVTARLFHLLDVAHEGHDRRVGLLLAVGLQPATSFTKAQRAVLGTCVLKQRLYAHAVPDRIAAYAAEALGRVGGPDAGGLLQRGLLLRRSSPRDVTRSCALALGRLASRAKTGERVAIAKALIKRVKLRGDTAGVNFALMSLADVVIAEVVEDRTDVLRETDAEELLLRTVAEGRAAQRPFAALALARVGARIGDDPDLPAYRRLRTASISVLRAGLASKRVSPGMRGSYAVALGMLRDPASVKVLVSLVKIPTQDRDLCAYAALALGLICQAAAEVTGALQPLLRADEDPLIRAQAAKALAMLRHPARAADLQRELTGSSSAATRAETVWALAEAGNETAIEPLLALLNDPKQSALVRGIACAGLGQIGDREWVPSLSRISGGTNYLWPLTALMHELLSIL